MERERQERLREKENLEGDKRKDKGCYYETQAKDNTMEFRKKGVIQQGMEKTEKRFEKNTEEFEERQDQQRRIFG